MVVHVVSSPNSSVFTPMHITVTTLPSCKVHRLSVRAFAHGLGIRSAVDVTLVRPAEQPKTHYSLHQYIRESHNARTPKPAKNLPIDSADSTKRDAS